MARRSATFSGVYPPTTGSSMLKYANESSSAGTCAILMPRFARLGASLLLGIAWLANSSGTLNMRSISSLRNESQRGCVSSITATSTRSIIGMRLPFWRAAIS